jgi:phospholipid transport system substrate-binding protein
MHIMRANRSSAWLVTLLGVAAVAAAPAVYAQAQPQAAPAPATVPGQSPQELVQSVAQNLLKELDANRAEYTKDPQKLRALVDKYLLPAFDVDYAARLVLGKNWRTATDAQKKRFIDAFYGSMMRNYGDAIVEFHSDRLKILPFKGDPSSGSATVRTEVTRDNGTPVPVNYSLHATPQGWKVWDVTIEGISYVRSYRTDFGAEADQKGLDAVIQRLETQNASGKPDPALQPGKTASKP